MNLNSTKTSLTDVEEVLSDLELLGSEEAQETSLAGLEAILGSMGLGSVRSVPALKDFLFAYRNKFLLPRELPTILRSYRLAEGGKTRELILLDRELADLVWPEDLKRASRRIGRAQLSRLRPLADRKHIRRYQAAMDEGKCQGWHTVVYGIAAAAYHLPLRQALHHYAQKSQASFLQAGAQTLRLPMVATQALEQEVESELLQAVEVWLRGQTGEFSPFSILH